MKIAENYLLGIDLGTTNVKAIIMDENGTVVASSSKGNELIFPGPGMAEQNPGHWWENTAEIIRTIAMQVGPDIVKKVRGICVSSHIVSMLPVDKDGNPLRNAMIWMDHRSDRELQYILDEIGFSKFVSIVGAQPDVAFLPNKILWLKRNEPELFEKTACILQASSYINYKLTGQMIMDIDQASRCQCLNINTLQWSDEISQAIGADLKLLLPEVKATDEIIGHVTNEAAAETGLISGIPVVAGASDAMASMYATGLCKIGEAGESSGTTSLVFVGHTHPSATDIPVVTKPCAIAGMPYLFDAPINATGASLNWYLNTLGKEEKEAAALQGKNVFEYINELAAEVPAGSNGLMFFPYMMGERAPLWNSHSRGMFIGLSLDTQRSAMIRSIMEGTAFALRHVMNTIKESGAEAHCLRITGGGAKSRVWSQIKASMLNMPVYLMDEKSGDVPFGDAIIAGHAAGVFPDLTTSINKLVQIKEIIEPVDEWARIYDRMYPLYLDMYRHLDADLMQLKSIFTD
ncbi:carbohydrate kinase [Anoxybacterium hadale]|uniref:Carbohydrate kinase n=1 Tax=Anoxybacterium hadale TaxID=3408580 RepID=A0ACD1AD27_9FIRM|nr:carbohydrate kinase [Clostridiales bacterium]